MAGGRPGAHRGLVALAEMGLYFLTGGLTGFLVDRERRESRRVKEAENLALLGQAAAAVAHELKTPLIAIGGFAQRIQRDLEPSHPYRHQLSIIVDQVRHMENLLRQMLDYSRPLELQRRPVPIDKLVEEVFALTAPAAQERGVALEQELPDNGLTLAGDPGRMQQVLINLVNNAVQASPQGGKVMVRATQGKDQVVLEVSDQGVGVPEEERGKNLLPLFHHQERGHRPGLGHHPQDSPGPPGPYPGGEPDRPGGHFQGDPAPGILSAGCASHRHTALLASLGPRRSSGYASGPRSPDALSAGGWLCRTRTKAFSSIRAFGFSLNTTRSIAWLAVA